MVSPDFAPPPNNGSIPFAELELQRLEVRQTTNRYKVGIVTIVTVAVLYFLVLSLKGGDVPIPVIVGPPAALVLLLEFLIRRKSAAFNNSYLNAILPPFLEQIDRSIEYVHEGGISETEFKNSELFRGFNRYKSSNLIRGSLHQTSFTMGFVHAENKRSGKNSSTGTIFKGVILIADFNKHFRSKVRLFPDGSENFLWGLGRKLQPNHQAGTSLTRMDNQEFENMFKVYVSDEVEARYILTQDLMSRILEMSRRLGGSIKIAFNEQLLTIAVPTDHFLKVSLNTPADSDPSIQELRLEIEAFVSIIDQLNLNTRIWTKQ